MILENKSHRGIYFWEGVNIPDIQERESRREVKTKKKAPKNRSQRQTVKAAGRQLTAKGREALAQRPKGEESPIEQADAVTEQAAVGIVDETAETVRHGGGKVKDAVQLKRQGIKEKRQAQAATDGLEQPDIREREPSRPKEKPVVQVEHKSQPKERPGPVASMGGIGKQTVQAQPTPQERMKRAAIKERQKRAGRPASGSPAEIPPIQAEGYVPQWGYSNTSTSITNPPKPPDQTAPYPSVTRSAQQGGECPPVSERIKGRFAPKQKPPGGVMSIKTRQRIEQRAVQANFIKAPKGAIPGRAARKEAARQAQKQVTQQGQAKLIQQAKQTARAAANFTRKTTEAMTKAVAAMINALAGITGGGVLLVLFCMVVLVAAIVSSPFGIFFSDEQRAPGTVSSREAVAQLNAEYTAKIEALQSGSYDGIEMRGQPAEWRDILTVFAVKTAGAEDGVDVATLNSDRVDRLKAVYWDMTTITSWVETIDHDDSDPDDDEDDSWTEYILHIVVTARTADEAADYYGFTPSQKSMLDELQAPGNNELWLALLYGVSATDDQIVAVALSQLGNVGGDPYWSWYGYTAHVDWCACFVSWCANECGYLSRGIIPKFASCSLGSRWFKSRGQWEVGSIEPVPGMLIFFDWDGDTGQDGSPDHVGIVKSVENGRVYTVEGNSGDQCREKSYPIGWYEIYGYGVPNY